MLAKGWNKILADRYMQKLHEILQKGGRISKEIVLGIKGVGKVRLEAFLDVFIFENSDDEDDIDNIVA